MTLSNKVLMVLIIVIIVFSSSLNIYADSETSLNIHLGEDGLIKLANEGTDNMEGWKILIEKYKLFIAGIAGMAAITMIFLFIKGFTALAISDGPQERSEAIRGLLTTGMATALLGAIGTITALFYKIF